MFFSANALFDHGSLTLIPMILALSSPSFAIESRNVHISLVHTLVNAPGKNARIKASAKMSLRFWRLKSVSKSVKSRAFCPIWMLVVIFVSFLLTLQV